jgi:hypothetical protein
MDLEKETASADEVIREIEDDEQNGYDPPCGSIAYIFVTDASEDVKGGECQNVIIGFVDMACFSARVRDHAQKHPTGKVVFVRLAVSTLSEEEALQPFLFETLSTARCWGSASENYFSIELTLAALMIQHFLDMLSMSTYEDVGDHHRERVVRAWNRRFRKEMEEVYRGAA